MIKRILYECYKCGKQSDNLLMWHKKGFYAPYTNTKFYTINCCTNKYKITKDKQNDNN